MNLPIILIFKDDPKIYATTDEDILKKSSLDLIDKFKEASIIDSTGMLYKIKRAYKVKWATLFWGYHPLFKGRMAKIEFEMESEYSINLRDFKDIVLGKINKKYFKHLYFDIEKKGFLELIAKQNNHKELIELFLYDPIDGDKSACCTLFSLFP